MFYIKEFKLLQEYESLFSEVIENNKVKIIRDININPEIYRELRLNIKSLIMADKFLIMKRNTSLAVSVFLVNCISKGYSDSNIWITIFEDLKIEYNYSLAAKLGDIFLEALDQYNLLKIESASRMKYLSPMIMHTYFANNHANKVFDRLNRIYELVFERNISMNLIEEYWDALFEGQANLNSLKEREKSINGELLEIDSYFEEVEVGKELENFSEEKYLTLNSELKELNTRNDKNKIQIKLLNNKIQKLENEKDLINDIIFYTQYRIPHIKTQELLDLGEFIINSFKKLLEDYFHKIGCLKKEIEEKKSENNKIYNNRVILDSRLNKLLTQLSILGSGDLKGGWEEIGRYNMISTQYENKKKELNKIQKEIKINENLDSQDFTSLLTTSLFHLKLADKGLFKEFMFKLFKMMDTYYKYNYINENDLFSNEFLLWVNSNLELDKIKDREVNFYEEKNEDKQNHDKKVINKKINKKVYSRRLRLAKLINPKFKLDINEGCLNLLISEQNFLMTNIPNIEAKYYIRKKDSTMVELNPNTINTDNNFKIFPLIYKLNLDESELFFKLLNIRDIKSIEVNSIMLFDSNFLYLDKKHCINDTYYILAKKEWELINGEIISRENTIYNNWIIYELHLKESSITFKNRTTNDTYKVVASNYHNIEFKDLNILEGITANREPIIMGKLPIIVYNKELVCDKDIRIEINTKNYLIFKSRVEDLFESDLLYDNIRIVDLNKILDSNIYHPQLLIINLYKKSELIISERFMWEPKNSYIFEDNYLKNKLPGMAKVKHDSIKVRDGWRILSFLSKEKEEYGVYYEKYGMVKYCVELPQVNIIIQNRNGDRLERGIDLLKEELDNYKDYSIMIESTSNIINKLHFTNMDGLVDFSIMYKEGKTTLLLDNIIDLLCTSKDKDSLFINWESRTRRGEKIGLINIFESWIIKDVEVYTEEKEDEYILEVKYAENFHYKGAKYIKIYDKDNIIFEKFIKEDNPFYYIKKSQITDENITIEIYTKKETSIFFKSQTSVNIVARTEIKLISMEKEIKEILNRGLTLESFTYFKRKYKLNSRAGIHNIKESKPLNFTGEKIYRGKFISNKIIADVLFYIDLENRRLPILLDLERDGAQFDKGESEVFWEQRMGNNILAPIENFDYRLGGE